MADNTCNTLAQRRAFLSLSMPPIRYNGLVNPYVNSTGTQVYTPSQLDMRRKAEILQYNKSSSQTGKLTKSQKFAQAINVNVTRAVTTICANDLYAPSLSSSCDVPGPVITLRYDPTVPLYNYAQNVASLGLINSEDVGKWTDSTSDNIIAYDSIETTLVDLAIGNITSQTTTFSINSPIGIYVDGTSVSSASGDISLNDITVAVYYNDTNYLLTSVIQPTITATTDIKTARFTRIASSPFSGVIYVGNLSITNLVLPTMYGYVYKIKVTFNMTTNATGINKRVYMNFTTGTTLNCTLVATSSVSPQIPYSISGV